jgi:hypothetical protein
MQRLQATPSFSRSELNVETKNNAKEARAVVKSVLLKMMIVFMRSTVGGAR